MTITKTSSSTTLDQIQNLNAEGIYKSLIRGGETGLLLGNPDDLVEACLAAFVQANWLGPPLAKNFPDCNRDLALERLASCGEQPYPLVKYPWLLDLALKISEDMTVSQSWKLRALNLHLYVLDGLSEELLNRMVRLKDEASLTEPYSLLETALAMLDCGKQDLCDYYLTRAGDLWGFKFQFSGALGKRTKHQSFEVAQLVVETFDGQDNQLNGSTSTERNNLKTDGQGEPPKESSLNERNSPNNVVLIDDDLLDKVLLTGGEMDGNVGTPGKLILLAYVAYFLKFYAKEVSLINKCLAIISKILEKPCQWSIFSTALYYRSKVEAQNNRLIERSALQYQALADQVELDQNHCPFPERFEHFFSVKYPPIWEIDRGQARLFAGLGAFKTAAKIFERRAMTEELVACLIQIGERNDAETLLMKGLEKNPNDPKLLTLLGDLRNDPSLYEQAWRASNHRYARAMRALGMHYIRSDCNHQAMQCFEKALAINGLFPKIWFLLGCLAIQMEDWNRARNAFSRTVADDPDNGDAWNNLAAVYLQLDNPEEALIALKQAAKLQFESWKIWSNIFQVARQLGDLLEMAAAYRRVAEIREKETPLTDLDLILEGLEDALIEFGPEDPFVNSARRQVMSLLETTMITYFCGEHQFWYQCARFAKMFNLAGDEIEFYFKAYRTLQSLPIENDKESLTVMADCLKRLGAAIQKLPNKDRQIEHHTSYQQIVQNISIRCQANFWGSPILQELSSLVD